jgi:hypothetical protein
MGDSCFWDLSERVWMDSFRVGVEILSFEILKMEEKWCIVLQACSAVFGFSKANPRL